MQTLNNQSQITISVCQGRQALYNLIQEWDRLVSGEEWPIYARPEWFLSWWNAFGDNLSLKIITARLHNELVGIMPICQKRMGITGLFFRTVEPVIGGADYYCPLIKKGYETAILPLMLDKVRDIFGRSNVFIWHNMPGTSAAIQIMRAWIKSNNLLHKEEVCKCPRIRFGEDYSKMESIWKGEHRYKIRKCKKRLNELGKVQLWIAPTKKAVKDILPEFFNAYDKKWHAKGFPGKFSDKATRNYYYNVTDNLWDKGLHFSTLMVNGINVSYLFGFLSGNWLFWYAPTYRIAYSKYSPSHLHINYLIEEGIKNGWLGIDFLKGDESYKYSWSNEETKVITFIVGSKYCLPSYLWFAYLKPLAREKFSDFYMIAKRIMQKCGNFLNYGSNFR